MRAPSLKSKHFKRTCMAKQDSAFKSGANQHKPAKRTRNRVPPPQRERILHKYVRGQSIVGISVEEHRNRETVSRIVHGPEMRNFVRAMRERWFALGHDAIAAVEYALKDQKDGRLGFQFLLSIGVIPSPAERQVLRDAEVQAGEDDDAGVKKILAALIEQTIERASIYGFRDQELETDLEKVGGKINYKTRKIEVMDKKTTT